MTEREKIFNKKRGLKQYHDKTDIELYKLIDRELSESELKASFVGIKDEEMQRALDSYYKYIDENSFENAAEKSSLVTLVYFEILKERIQKFIEEEEKDKKSISFAGTERIMEIDTQIMGIKEKLGMLKNQDNDTFVKTWEELKKKALTYYNEHAGETYVRCPECQKLFRILMKLPDEHDVVKATFFKGTTLYNEEVLKLYHNKVITLEQAAKIHGVHAKYIISIYENIFLKSFKPEGV